VQNARKACGTHSALVREVNSSHVVLVRLESEVEKEGSIFSGGEGSEDKDGRGAKMRELLGLMRECERVLKISKEILEKVCLFKVYSLYSLLIDGKKLTFFSKVQCITR
jgi:hypothetical protein